MTGGPVARSTTPTPTAPDLRLLASGLGRRHLHLRLRPIPRFDRQPPRLTAHRRYHPTTTKAGYWLVASDGGIFAFGNAGYFGSIPGAGLNPAGSGLPHSLDAPIVGMVPSSDGGGYFMVASDGGVFAFGDARFEGSCPGIGGCSGAAVAVVPDASGNGYWLITQSGSVYAFGDAPSTVPREARAHRSPPPCAQPTDTGTGSCWPTAPCTPTGTPSPGVARSDRSGASIQPPPYSRTPTGGGYWVASAQGAVFSYGDAPNDGSMAGTAQRLDHRRHRLLTRHA